MAQLVLTERAVRAFRLHRMGLAGGGLADPESVLRQNLFVQAQIEVPALLGLSARLASRPTQAAVRELLLKQRALVRSWGPRDTLHLFSLSDWPGVVAARPAWVKSARAGHHPLPPTALEQARARVAALGQTFTRTDLRDLLSDDWIASFQHDYFNTPDKKWRFGAGRLVWILSGEGRCCHAHREGSEQAYAPQHLWLPAQDVVASAARLETVAAAAAKGRRYLGTYGPATVQDMAHFFGARISDARQWIAQMPNLIAVRCGERDLLACAEDAPALRAAADQPLGLRLLPGYDNLLMGHADKHWTVPVVAERKAIWRKAAIVEAVVLVDGVVVGTWESAVRGSHLTVTITPLSGWHSAHQAQAETEAVAVAHHLGCTTAALQLR